MIVPLLAAAAFAVDADPFDPSAAMAHNTGTLQGESAQLGPDGPAGGLITTFAQNLLIFDYGEQLPREEALPSALPLTAYGGYTYDGKFRVDAFVPVYAWVEVDSPVDPRYRGPAMGDMRVQGTVPFWKMDERLELAVVPRVGLPTGNQDALVSRGFHGGLLAAASGEFDQRYGYTGNLGVTGSGADQIGGVTVGPSFDALVGGHIRPSESFRFGGELQLMTSLVAFDEDKFNTVSTGHLFAQNMLDNGLSMTVGAGTGLLAGIGAPEYRMFTAITYAKRESDKDKDGILDRYDVCPEDPEDLDGFQDSNGCPDPDNDRDGVLDTADQCPDTKEDLDGWEDTDGCPEDDNDGDGLLDADDACPDARGPAGAPQGCPDSDKDGLSDNLDACPTDFGPKTTEGCPDSDSDGIADSLDACPTEAGPEGERVEVADGCPKRIYLTLEAIEHRDGIEFEEGSNKLTADSLKVIDRIIGRLSDWPHIKVIEVQGHTHNQGDGPEANERLSQRRAARVVSYLQEKKVELGMVARGYGQEKPVNTNRTSRGRDKNERIDLVIKEQDPMVAEAEPVEEAPVAPQASGPGFLTVVLRSDGWANVYIDDVKLSKSAPFEGIELAAGKHKIWVASVQLGIDQTEEIDVKAGETYTITVGKEEKKDDLPWGATEPEPEPPPAEKPEEKPEEKPAEKAPEEEAPKPELPWDLPTP